LLERFHKTASHQAAVVAVSIDTDDRRRVKSYLDKLSIRALPVYHDPEGKLAGNAAKGTAPLPIYGMPLTYLVTPTGRIAGYMPGVADSVAADAQKLLAYYASASNISQLLARYLVGSTGVEPLRISKCSCGEVTLPVWPDSAITWPRRMVSPRLTSNSLALA